MYVDYGLVTMVDVLQRLTRAYIKVGGTLEDERAAAKFRTFVQHQMILLSPHLRRTLELVLESPGDCQYSHLVARLSREEGRPVRAATVRQRVSRGTRALLTAIRTHRWGPEVTRASSGLDSIAANGERFPLGWSPLTDRIFRTRLDRDAGSTAGPSNLRYRRRAS